MADAVIRFPLGHCLENIRIGVVFQIFAVQIVGGLNYGADHQRHPLAGKTGSTAEGFLPVDAELIGAYGDGAERALHIGENFQPQQNIGGSVFQHGAALQPFAGFEFQARTQPVGSLCHDFDIQPRELSFLIDIGVRAEVVIRSHPKDGG